MVDTITFDGLTARLLRPCLASAGLKLADLAQSLARAAQGSYERRQSYDGQGRETGGFDWWDFTTHYAEPGSHVADLLAPGSDEFSWAGEKRRIQGLPAIWGGLARRGRTHQLALAGMRLGTSAVVSPYGGEIILTGVDLPESIRAAATGRPLREIVAHPLLAGLDLPITAWRDVPPEEALQAARHEAPGVGISLEATRPLTLAFHI